MAIYEIYSDESNYNQTNHGSVGVLSGSQENLAELKEVLDGLLAKYGRIEKGIEFKNIDGDSTKLSIAKEFVLNGLIACSTRKVRIDVITWNKSDSRNGIQGRDDIQNMLRMYYHVLHYAKKHWKYHSLSWNFFPDEQTAISWETDIIQHIQNTNLSRSNKFENTLFGEFVNLHFPVIENHCEVKSHENSLLQLVDIFTGLCNFSFQSGADFIDWTHGEGQEMNNNTQIPMFINNESTKKHSRGNKAKFLILKIFLNECKCRKLGISFNTNLYLCSPDKGKISNMNFWLYAPQHEHDKAPTKGH